MSDRALNLALAPNKTELKAHWGSGGKADHCRRHAISGPWCDMPGASCWSSHWQGDRVTSFIEHRALKSHHPSCWDRVSLTLDTESILAPLASRSEDAGEGTGCTMEKSGTRPCSPVLLHLGPRGPQHLKSNDEDARLLAPPDNGGWQILFSSREVSSDASKYFFQQFIKYIFPGTQSEVTRYTRQQRKEAMEAQGLGARQRGYYKPRSSQTHVFTQPYLLCSKYIKSHLKPIKKDTGHFSKSRLETVEIF